MVLAMPLAHLPKLAKPVTCVAPSVDAQMALDLLGLGAEPVEIFAAVFGGTQVVAGSRELVVEPCAHHGCPLRRRAAGGHADDHRDAGPNPAKDRILARWVHGNCG